MSSKTPRIEFHESKVDAIFAELDQGQLPGAAVGIAIAGKPVYRRGFGLASMELPVLLSPSIRMRIYSITKHFTCLAYLLLCEEGKVGVDDPVGKFLPELHAVTHKVTMRQLMGHTSGLRDSLDICYQFSGTGLRVASAELLSLYRDIDDVNFPPGGGWCYCNGGFLILSVAIERITGRSLEDVLLQRIFEPVGMHDTLLRRFDTDFVSNSATMHMTGTADRYEKSYLGLACAGEGGMVSTVDDMLRWLAHMDEPRIGSADTWELMRTPQTLANGTTTGYGLGLTIDHYRGIETLHHAGGGMGANSQMLKVPAAGLDVMVMANRQDVSSIELVNKILDACMPELEPVAAGCSQPLRKRVFRSTATGRVIQLGTCPAPPASIKDGQHIVSIDGGDLPMESHRDGVLRPAGSYGSMKFDLILAGEREEPDSIRFTDFGNLDELALMRPIDEPDVSTIVGHYQSEATGTAATIFDTNDGPRLSTVGRFGSAEFSLECLADSIWRAKSMTPMPWGGILLFNDGATGFHFSNLRMRSLPFRRCI